MNPRFFIDRPIFAWVVALCILLGGVLTLRALPIEQYPTVAPPSLTISATYPGADAATLEQNVTQVIEQELNGVEDLLYMASTSNSNGSASITVTFESGTDIVKAQMDVQNQLTLVEQRLPEEVRRQGIPVRQANAGFLMLIEVGSKSGQTAHLELGNFANARILDELRRVEGVCSVQVCAWPNVMGLWIDPQTTGNYSLPAAEPVAAGEEYKSQRRGWRIGNLTTSDE